MPRLRQRMQKLGNPLTDTHNLVTLFTVIAIITADQITKAWIRTYPPARVISGFGFVRIVHTQNSGSVFGLFQGQSSALAIVATVVIVALLALAFWVYTRFPYLVTKWNRVAFGLILGGAIGNLIDRLLFSGMVTDFLETSFWATFNIADSGITVGEIMFGICVIRLALIGKHSVN